MPRDWESIFSTWTKPSSDTECEKQENAERMIREAIKEYVPLKSRDIRVIPQGSYRNNTNVRQESDVDICVCCMTPYYTDYQFADYGDAEANNSPGGYNYSQLKNEVENALVQKFGRNEVKRGDKAFDVHANTYRVDADVVAAFAHRRYQKRYYDPLLDANIISYTKPEGTQFFTDSGQEVINWPEQHYAQGVAKNKRTGYRFKSVVRALKNLKYVMEANGNPAQRKAAQEAPSFLVECLTYNVQDGTFAGDSCRTMARDVIYTAYHATKTEATYKDWVEVSEMKYLFRGVHAWTIEQAHAFLLSAWQYGEFS